MMSPIPSPTVFSYIDCLPQTAKVLANAVIPNEYGIDPAGKLRIGSKICSSLLGKILADLANMRDESLATVNTSVRDSSGGFSRVQGFCACGNCEHCTCSAIVILPRF